MSRRCCPNEKNPLLVAQRMVGARSKKCASSPPYQSPTFATWGNSGIGSDTGPGNQLSRTNAPASCGLAMMESSDEELCWTGRVVEADFDLCGG